MATEGGGIGRKGPGKGRRAPNLTFSNIFEPGRAVSSPLRDFLLRPATLPRTFIFFRFFTIPASEPSNSIEIDYSAASRAIGCKGILTKP